MGAKLATLFSNSGSASGSTTVQISQGTCFAYLPAKIDWDKKKTEIADLDDDQWSFG